MNKTKVTKRYCISVKGMPIFVFAKTKQRAYAKVRLQCGIN